MSSEIVSEIKNQIKYFNIPLKKLPPSPAHNRLSLKSRLAFNLFFLFYHYTMYFHSQSSSSSLLDNAKSPRGNLFFVHCLFTLTQCSVLSSQQFPLRVSISVQIFFVCFRVLSPMLPLLPPFDRCESAVVARYVCGIDYGLKINKQ